MEENKKPTFEERCEIMEPAMKQAIQILVTAHEACQFEGGDGEGIVVIQPEMSNGKKYFLKFCRLEDATFKDLKQARKLDKPSALRSIKLSDEQIKSLTPLQD